MNVTAEGLIGALVSLVLVAAMVVAPVLWRRRKKTCPLCGVVFRWGRKAGVFETERYICDACFKANEEALVDEMVDFLMRGLGPSQRRDPCP